MFRLCVLALFLGGAVWLGLNMHQSGVVWVKVHEWTLELPLWLSAIGLLLGFVAVHYFLRILKAIWGAPKYWAQLSRRRRNERAKKRTNQGLIELAEGHWASAEKQLIRGAQDCETPLLNYLSAARAAQEQGESQRRDLYLRLAHGATTGADMAVGLTQAQLQLSHGQYEQSLATLNHLRTLAPRHPYVLKLLKTLYIQLKDWDQLLQILPLLKKNPLMEEGEVHALERRVYRELLLQGDRQTDVAILQSVWEKLPKAFQQDNDLVYLYVNGLNDHQKGEQAELVLRNFLKRHWCEQLIQLYGLIQGAQVVKQLSYAEGWIKAHENSPGLFLSLGRLAIKNKLWGKAQRYFEASLALEADTQTYAELGRLLDFMGKPQLSAQCYRKGLLLMVPVVESSACGAAQVSGSVVVDNEGLLATSHKDE